VLVIQMCGKIPMIEERYKATRYALGARLNAAAFALIAGTLQRPARRRIMAGGAERGGTGQPQLDKSAHPTSQVLIGDWAR
jgi:hypothetical protein